MDKPSKVWGLMCSGKDCDGGCQGYQGAETHEEAHDCANIDNAITIYFEKHGEKCTRETMLSILEQLVFDMRDLYDVKLPPAKKDPGPGRLLCGVRSPGSW